MLLTAGWISCSQKIQFSANQDKQWLLWRRFISFSSLRNQATEATTVVAMTTIHLFPIAGNLTTEQRQQSLLSQHRCLAE